MGRRENVVRVNTSNGFLKNHNIFTIAFMFNKRFGRYKFTNRHDPLMVYYPVDSHMYWVSNQHKARQLAGRGKDSCVRIKLGMFQSYEDSNNTVVDKTYV